MYNFLMTMHVTACVLLIVVVLLQAGRGAGLSMFGGGGGDMLATPTGTSFMKRLTGWLAATFAATSLLLTLLSGRAGLRSVTNSVPLPPPPAAQQAPAPQGATSAPAAGGQTSGQPAPGSPQSAPGKP